MTLQELAAARHADAVAAEGFEVCHVDGDGGQHRGPLGQGWATRFEDALPMRRFTARKGQRHLSGLWWVGWLRLPPAARQGRVSVLPAVEPAVTERTLQRKVAAVSAFYGFHRRLDPMVTLQLTRWDRLVFRNRNVRHAPVIGMRSERAAH